MHIILYTEYSNSVLNVLKDTFSWSFSHAVFFTGSLGDLDGGEENTPDNLSLSGEDGGASDPEDSAEGDSSSPPPYMPLYNEGEDKKWVVV